MLIRSLDTQVLKPGGGRAMLQRLYEDYLMAKLQQRAGSRAAAGGAGAGGISWFVWLTGRERPAPSGND